jgi:hypothetical protein
MDRERKEYNIIEIAEVKSRDIFGKHRTLSKSMLHSHNTLTAGLPYIKPSLPAYSTSLTGQPPALHPISLNSGQFSIINALIISCPFNNAPLVQTLPSLTNLFSTHVVLGSCLRSSSTIKRGAVAVLPARIPASWGARKPLQMVRKAVQFEWEVRMKESSDSVGVYPGR